MLFISTLSTRFNNLLHYLSRIVIIHNQLYGYCFDDRSFDIMISLPLPNAFKSSTEPNVLITVFI